MSKNIYFSYDNGISTCTIIYKNKKFIGTATCHPDDVDFESDKTGLSIAEARAAIKVLQYQKQEIKNQLHILIHLWGNMHTSKYYNPKSYEARMIKSQIRALESNISMIDSQITDEKKYLKSYIDKKEELYQRLRAKN
jgi:hypothetical protein